MAKQVGISFEIDQGSLKSLQKALKTLGDTDAPFMREAISDSGAHFAGAVRVRAPGSMGGEVKSSGISGSGTGYRFKGSVTHPGARRMEFGRHARPYKGNSPKPGYAYTGQKARPFLGVKGGGATDAVRPYVVQRIQQGIAATWADIGGGG